MSGAYQIPGTSTGTSNASRTDLKLSTVWTIRIRHPFYTVQKYGMQGVIIRFSRT